MDPGWDTSSTSGGGRAGLDTARRRCDFGRSWVLPCHLVFCSLCDAGGLVTAHERHDPQPGSPSSGRFLPRAWWSTSTSTPGFALLFLPFIHSFLAFLIGSFSSELASYLCGPQNSGQTKEKPRVIGRLLDKGSQRLARSAGHVGPKSHCRSFQLGQVDRCWLAWVEGRWVSGPLLE